MTRKNLIGAIYDNEEEWSCAYTCPHTMEEENPKEVCWRCAEKQLAEYEQQIRADVICEIKKILPQSYCNNCNQISCDGGRVGSIQECASVRLLIDTLFELEDELKEQNK